LWILGQLDQMSANADDLLANPADTGNVPLIEDLKELLVDMQAKIEVKLDQASRR
jgi:hypothetical protein